MEYVITIIIAYIIGCSHMSYYIERIKGVKIKTAGSKNYGAANTMVLAGWWAGGIVAVHDIGKAALTVALVGWWFANNDYLPLIAGVACIVGHIFPFYLRFNGGKGFAAFLGMTIAFNWKLGLCMIVLVIAVTLITDYIVTATFATVVCVPVAIGILQNSMVKGLIVLIASAIILYKHIPNMKNLFNGTEMKLSTAHRKEYRSK